MVVLVVTWTNSFAVVFSHRFMVVVIHILDWMRSRYSFILLKFYSETGIGRSLKQRCVCAKGVISCHVRFGLVQNNEWQDRG